MVALRVGMRSRFRKAERLASYVRSSFGPTFSAAPLSGSRSPKARAAQTNPGSAAKKNARRQPKFSAT
jgi:hypothetical protein